MEGNNYFPFSPVASPYAENSFKAFLGGGGVLITFVQCNTQTSANTSNLLDNP